jgi:hypothetical protein
MANSFKRFKNEGHFNREQDYPSISFFEVDEKTLLRED